MFCVCKNLWNKCIKSFIFFNIPCISSMNWLQNISNEYFVKKSINCVAFLYEAKLASPEIWYLCTKIDIYYRTTLPAIIDKFITNELDVSSIVGSVNGQNSVLKKVCADDLTAERAIIASNVQIWLHTMMKSLTSTTNSASVSSMDAVPINSL